MLLQLQNCKKKQQPKMEKIRFFIFIMYDFILMEFKIFHFQNDLIADFIIIIIINIKLTLSLSSLYCFCRCFLLLKKDILRLKM
jgi:hypothetical protein